MTKLSMFRPETKLPMGCPYDKVIHDLPSKPLDIIRDHLIRDSLWAAEIQIWLLLFSSVIPLESDQFLYKFRYIHLYSLVEFVQNLVTLFPWLETGESFSTVVPI